MEIEYEGHEDEVSSQVSTKQFRGALCRKDTSRDCECRPVLSSVSLSDLKQCNLTNIS